MNDLSRTEASALSAATPRVLAGSERTLSEQLAAWLALRIDEHALKAGTRLPSIRVFAADKGVSRSTVVEAYDRLIAMGYVESRRGSGFFVRSRRGRTSDSGRGSAASTEAPHRSSIDVVWLLRSMLRQAPAGDHPGAGLLPSDWLDSELVSAAVRSVGRVAGSALLTYGTPEGYLPLRQQLVQRLAHSEISAEPDLIVTTHGVTHALDLVARHFIAPGDTVFVEDPAWFVMFGRFAAFGARVIGVPRGLDGPDLAVLANLLAKHKPKLFVVGSVLHNPTSTSISAATAHRLLQLADLHGFTIVEDDVYGDLHPRRGLRLASLDQLKRVIYIGGFSKTLAANLRVGYIAAAPEIVQPIADLKMLTGLTSSEIPERVVARILAEGHYRRHVDRLRGRLDAARERTARALEKMGARIFAPADAGIFLWCDFGRDTNAIAAEGSQQGILCAPGSLFSPTQLPSSWMRVSAATSLNPAALRFLAQSIG